MFRICTYEKPRVPGRPSPRLPTRFPLEAWASGIEATTRMRSARKIRTRRMNRKGLFLRTGGSAVRDVESLAANSSAQLKERHSDDQRVSRKSGNKLHDPISAHCKIKTIQPSTVNLMSLAAIGSPGDEVFTEEIVERPFHDQDVRNEFAL
jgi:hypothetical protein